jgi:hypothetical protein
VACFQGNPIPQADFLSGVSKHIWEKIRLIVSVNMKPKEEYLTEELVIEIKRNNPEYISILAFNKMEEAEKGADIELWIGSDSVGYTGISAQAKVVNTQTGRYDSLKHEVGGRQQIDILKEYSVQRRTKPIYLFYNYFNVNPNWTCKEPIDYGVMGCTYAEIADVEHAIETWGAKNFQSIHEFKKTLPLRCILCDSIIPYPGRHYIVQPWYVRSPWFHKMIPIDQGADELVDNQKWVQGKKEKAKLKAKVIIKIDTGRFPKNERNDAPSTAV